jgi:DNA-binding NtrC family response regulator
LIVDDEPDIRALLQDILDDEGYEGDVAESAVQAIERKPLFAPDLVLLDIWMPEMDGVSLLKHWNDTQDLSCPVVMMSGHGTVETAVEATRYGAYDFIEKPLSMAKLIRVVKSALSGDTSDDEQPPGREQPVGNSQIVQILRHNMQELAVHNAPVALTSHSAGERELWANYLFSLKPHPMPVRHWTSSDQGGALPGNVNLYVAEISELERASQQALLGLLRQPRNPNSNARIVIASRHDFRQLHADGSILPEIAEYWRDAVYIPVLNEHIEDMPELLEYYVNWFVSEQSLNYRHFGVAAQNLMRNHDWRGGLDDLKQVLQGLLSERDDEEVGLDEIKTALSNAQAANEQAGAHNMAVISGNQLSLSVDLDLDMREAREVFERSYLQAQLEMCGNNVSELARKIGLERTNLYRKLKSLGIHGRK